MTYKFDIVDLETLCLGIYDCPHSTPKWQNEGVPVIRNYNLKDGYIERKNLSYVDEQTYLERVKRATPEAEDIIISREAPMGVVGIVPKDFKCCLGQRLVLLKINKDICYPSYFLYVLMSHFVQQQINRINLTGSIVSNLNISDLKKLKIPVYSYDEQIKIAKILSNIDEKIALNNETNATLEQMAKTLYDYWFVQFDFPDDNGKPYKTSGGEMVYNETLKRDIPKGWDVKKLSEIANLKAGGDKPSEFSDIPTEDLTIPIFSNGIINDGLYGYTNSSTIKKPSITISARGTIGFSKIRMNPFVPIIRLISITPIEEFFLKYLEQFFKDMDFENSGSVQQQLTVPQIKDLAILLPSEKTLNKFHGITLNGLLQIENNNEQIIELTKLRDWLLPMLMNGQVTITGE